MLQANRLQREFKGTCKSGDIEVVESFLDRGALINQANEGGRASLLVACKAGHREIDFFRSYSDALPIVFYFCLIVRNGKLGITV